MQKDDILKSLVILFLSDIILYLLSYFSLLNVQILFDPGFLLFIGYVLGLILSNYLLRKYYSQILEHKSDLLSKVFIISMFIMFILSNVSLNSTIAIFYTLILVFIYSLYIHSYLLGRKESGVDNKVVNNKLSLPVLITFVLLFLAIRFAFILFYQGSYLDEYLHIFTGISWIDHDIHSIYRNIDYYRGIYVTALSAIVYFITGKSIFFQKLIPIMVSCINFYLIYKLAKRYLKKRLTLFALMLAYIIAPILIFNDTYIRSYIFFETFAYISIIISSSIISAYELQDNNKLTLNVSILIIWIGFIIWSKDIEALLFLLIPGIYLFFYSIFKFNQTLFIPYVKNGILKFKHLFGVVLLLVIIGYFFIDYYRYLDIFFHGNLVHGEGTLETYLRFFFKDNFFFTVLFINIFIVGIIQSKVKDKAFFLMLFTLFIIHMVISPDFRNLRGIFYFFPLYLLGGFVALEYLSIKNAVIAFAITLFITFSLLFHLSQYYVYGPSIPNEIDYFTFKQFYVEVNNSCNGRKVISMMHSNYIASFYNVKIDNVIFLKKDQLDLDERFYKTNDGFYYESADNLAVINDYQKLEELIKREKVCILVTNEFRHTSLYITANDFQTLFGHFDAKVVGSLKILSN